MRTLPCSHAFHADCLVGWFLQGNISCPYCRYRFGEDSSEDEGERPFRPFRERPPVETPEDPYWMQIFRRDYFPGSKVKQWVVSKIKALSRRKNAPSLLKKRVELKKSNEEYLRRARKLLWEFKNAKGTWQDLVRKHTRLLRDCRKAEDADRRAVDAVIKFCQANVGVRRYLMESRIPAPKWW